MEQATAYAGVLVTGVLVTAVTKVETVPDFKVDFWVCLPGLETVVGITEVYTESAT